MGIVKKGIIVGSIVLVLLLTTELMVRKRMDLVDVVVVNKTFPQRHLIEAKDLTTLKTSRHLIPEDAILNKEDLIGKYIKMEHTLLKNQMIRKDNVESLSDAIDAPHLLLFENERIYSLKKDVVGSAGASLQRGSYVDVAKQHKREGEYGVIIENVRVVGVKDRHGVEVEIGKVPHVILLAIDAQDVNVMLETEEEGKIVLLPRNVKYEN